METKSLHLINQQEINQERVVETVFINLVHYYENIIAVKKGWLRFSKLTVTGSKDIALCSIADCNNGGVCQSSFGGDEINLLYDFANFSNSTYSILRANICFHGAWCYEKPAAALPNAFIKAPSSNSPTISGCKLFNSSQ